MVRAFPTPPLVNWRRLVEVSPPIPSRSVWIILSCCCGHWRHKIKTTLKIQSPLIWHWEKRAQNRVYVFYQPVVKLKTADFTRRTLGNHIEWICLFEQTQSTQTVDVGIIGGKRLRPEAWQNQNHIQWQVHRQKKTFTRKRISIFSALEKKWRKLVIESQRKSTTRSMFLWSLYKTSDANNLTRNQI